MSIASVVKIKAQGGSEVMDLVEEVVNPPAAGQVQVRQTAIGLNYIDTYHRSGLYPVQLPSGLGLEAAGVVEAVGEGVEHLQIGDRIAYGTGRLGLMRAYVIYPRIGFVNYPQALVMKPQRR